MNLITRAQWIAMNHCLSSIPEDLIFEEILEAIQIDSNQEDLVRWFIFDQLDGDEFVHHLTSLAIQIQQAIDSAVKNALDT